MAGRGIVLLDGGMGQELLKRGTKAATPLWSAQFLLDQPDIVKEVHADYIKAGATVITLNTYSATPERLTRDGDVQTFDAIHENAVNAAKGARAEYGADVKIAGCLPPLVASYHPELSPAFDDALASYRKLVAAQQSGADVFLCETMACISEAKAALRAGKESGKPVWVGLTVDDDDGAKLRSGESLRETIDVLKEQNPDAIVINCSQPEAVENAIPILAASGVPFGAYANGFVSIAALAPGGTVASLRQREDLGPSVYADYVMGWIEQGASIVGGCCEVGPAHIKEIHDRLLKAGYWIEGTLPSQSAHPTDPLYQQSAQA